MVSKLLSTPNLKYEFFVRSCIVGIVYSASILLFITSSSLLGVPVIHFDIFTSFLLEFLGGIVLSLVLGYVSVSFPYPKNVRFALIFAILFVIGYLSNIVEYLFFSTATLEELYYEIVYMLIVHIITATGIVYLFPPAQMDSSLSEVLRSYFSTHASSWWILRIFIAGALYLPVYLFFGALFSPIIVPFYTDPSYGLELVIPPFEIIIPLEIVRGVVYVILLIPVIASVNLDRTKQNLLLAAILFCVGALPGLLANQTWPILLRVAHGLEIAADSLVYGYVILKIIKKHKTQ